MKIKKTLAALFAAGAIATLGACGAQQCYDDDCYDDDRVVVIEGEYDDDDFEGFEYDD